MSTLPAGYRPDTHGRLVPVERIRPIDLARDELVTELVAEARELSLRLQRFKARAFADVAAFVELSAERYGARVRLTGSRPLSDEEFASVLERANAVVLDIAKQDGYDLIVQEAVYINPKYDLTDRIIKALDR